jgi:4-hydroxy-3-methylbut-2-enyl diphosphate reductase
MKIIVAKTAGFCMGVKRAVDMAIENAGKVPNGLKTIGPLIHNQQTLDMLRQRKVTEFEEKDNNGRPSTLLIRAHGIPPAMQKRYVGQGHAIIDGTCPKVKTVHTVIERYRAAGYAIVIAGDKGHAEIIGLMGYAGNMGHLINTVSDIDTLPDFEKVCLVSQTTFDRTAFDEIAAKIRSRYNNRDVVIKKTICAATDQRQAETETLAKHVDAVIVVGGKNSANTRRLVKIAGNGGTPTQLVETEEDIDWNAIAHCKSVGVTAGASTPNWMIKRVTDYLQFMDRTQKRTVPNLARQVLDIAANLNIFVALGAVAAYYVSCRTQGYAFTAGGGTLAFLYFLSMYLWNSVTSLETTQHLGISRYKFYRRYKPLLLSLASVSIAALLIGCLPSGKSLFFLMLFATAAGSVYHVTIVPVPLRQFIKYKNLKDIPTSRDLFVALAWGTVLTFMPQAINGSFAVNPLIIACFMWVFVLAFLRSLIFDLRDIEGDRIMGRETLITIVGEKKSRKAIYGIIGLCIVLLIAVPWLADLESDRHRSAVRFLSQIPTLLYAAMFVAWNPRLKSSSQVLFTIMADGLFYVAGLGALCASMVLGI